MLDFIYHKTMMITSKLLRNSIFGGKSQDFATFTQPYLKMDIIT